MALFCSGRAPCGAGCAAPTGKNVMKVERLAPDVMKVERLAPNVMKVERVGQDGWRSILVNQFSLNLASLRGLALQPLCDFPRCDETFFVYGIDEIEKCEVPAVINATIVVHFFQFIDKL